MKMRLTHFSKGTQAKFVKGTMLTKQVFDPTVGLNF